MTYSTQLERIEEAAEEYDNLMDDIHGEEHVRDDVAYHRDKESVDVLFELDGIDRERFEDVLEHQYAAPYSKRFRLDRDDDTYRVRTIYGDSFEVQVGDDEARLHFDPEDDDWAFEEGRRLAQALDE